VLAISLALGSSACYGISNFIGPQLVRRHTLVSVLMLSQLAALIACVLYLAASGGRALPAPDLWLALLAGAGNAAGLIWFYKAAQLGPLSVVAPIGAVGAVIPVIWGLAGGDSLRASRLAGIVLALGGAALAARRGADYNSVEGFGHDRDSGYPNLRASAIWAAASAIGFGVFLTALPKAAAHGRAWALLDARLALVLAMTAWAGRELRTLEFGRASVKPTIPGLLLVTGTLMYTTAADHGQLSLVSVLGSLFPIFTVGLGVALLGERLAPIQIAGVSAALAGIVLIAL
jgi:drug/metabolite transporter (DMT)-like permease